jgi:hypothetical protein
LNIYLKIFLRAGIPFGVFMGCLFGYLEGAHKGLIAGITSGLLFGTWMSVIFGTVHEVCTKKIYGPGEVNPKQSKAIESNLPFDSGFEKCVNALGHFGAKITAQDKAQGRIEAKTGMTWKSFGETISIHLDDLKNGTIKIQISSAPVIKTTIMDYGKGRANVETIASLLAH